MALVEHGRVVRLPREAVNGVRPRALRAADSWDTSRWSGQSRPGPARGSSCRSAGRASPRGGRHGSAGGRSRPLRASASRVASSTPTSSIVSDLADRRPRVDPGGEAALRAGRCCRCRRPASGRAAHRRAPRSGPAERIRAAATSGSKSSASTSGPRRASSGSCSSCDLADDPHPRPAEVDRLRAAARPARSRRREPAGASARRSGRAASCHACRGGCAGRARPRSGGAGACRGSRPLEPAAVELCGRQPVGAALTRGAHRDLGPLQPRRASVRRAIRRIVSPSAIYATSLRGCRRKPASIRAASSPGADHRLPVEALYRELLDLSALSRLGERRPGPR